MPIQVFQPDQGQIFLDESQQTVAGTTIYSVSAYVTRYDSVAALTDEWTNALKAKGVAAFHGRELRSPSPPAPYDGWSQSERDAFVLRLAEIAASHMIVGLGCTVYESDFRDEIPATYPPHLKAFFADPFAFCLNVILGMCLEMEHARQEKVCRLYLPRPLDFVFDKKQKFVGKAMTIWRWRGRQDPEGKTLASFTLEDDTRFPQLQVADLLAYYVARRLIDPGTKGVAREVDEKLRALGDRIGFAQQPRSRIREFVELLIAQPTADFVP